MFDKIISQIKERFDDEQKEYRVVCEVVRQHIGIDIPINTVKISQGVLYMNVHPTIMFSLRLKEKEIITTLQSRGVEVSLMK